jgi:hypothetical protein
MGIDVAPAVAALVAAVVAPAAGAAVLVTWGALCAWVGAVVAVVDAAGVHAAKDRAKMSTRDRATFVLMIDIKRLLYMKILYTKINYIYIKVVLQSTEGFSRHNVEVEPASPIQPTLDCVPAPAVIKFSHHREDHLTR